MKQSIPILLSFVCGFSAQANDLLITEIMQNPSAVSDSSGEWFELLNTSTQAINLNGWTFKDNDTDQFTIDQDIIVLAGEYTVLGKNSDINLNGGVTVSFAFGSDMFLSNGSDELIVISPEGSEVDRVEWDNGATFPDPIGKSMTLVSVTSDNNNGSNWFTESEWTYGLGDYGTPGTDSDSLNSDDEPSETTYTPLFIHQVQGNGAISPLIGEKVEVTAIVVGDFQDGSSGENGDFNGFFLQEESSDFDNDPLTSEGIFVFDGTSPNVDVSIGDKITVKATVSESRGNTQLGIINNIVILENDMLPETDIIELTLPTVNVTTLDSGKLVADLEQYEGMWVKFAQTLTVTELFNLDRFGQVRLAQGSRLFQFTQINSPDIVGYQAHLEDVARRTITLDDGLTSSNPDPIRYPGPGMTSSNTIRMGDEVVNLEGIITFNFGTYRLLPTTKEPSFSQSIPRPTRPYVGGTLSVASFNVLNFFNTLDTYGSFCYQGSCRGADSVEEYERQLAKTVTALVALNADIIGLIEIENNYTDDQNSAIAALTSAINTTLESHVDSNHVCTNYAYVSPREPNSGEVVRIGTDAIAVGFLYCSNTVKIADGSVPAILDDTALAALDIGTPTPLFNGTSTNRASLATTFTELATNESLTIAVNHFKSKGPSGLNTDSICMNTPIENLNCDQQDGQGFWNERRVSAADAVSAWLESNPTGSEDEDKLVIGDINAYKEEGPLKAFELAGYTNVIADGTSYSYVFDGQAGSLDHGLANPSLHEQLTGAADWNINADEADAIDYNLDFSSANYLFDPTVPYRSSDHDPVIMGFDLSSNNESVIGDYDGDDDVDIADIRALMSAYQLGLDIDPSFDLNKDGLINVIDIRLLMRLCTRAVCAVG